MKYFFSTSNYGAYFYLIGSLIYFFQALKADNVTLPTALLIVTLFILFSIFIVHYITPLHHKAMNK